MRIFTVDPNTILTQGLACLLADEPAFEFVGETADGREAVERITDLRPDIVLMEVTVPGLNGIDATRKIKKEVPGIKVIALSDRTDEVSVRQMLDAGATGYVTKQDGEEEIARAIRAVAKGQTFLSPAVAHVLVNGNPGAPEEVSGVFHDLTPREREVLQLVTEGCTSKEVARRLNISATTVDTHRHNVMKKLEVNTVADLVKLAIRAGITSLES